MKSCNISNECRDHCGPKKPLMIISPILARLLLLLLLLLPPESHIFDNKRNLMAS